MKRKYYVSFAIIILLLLSGNILAQSIGNYAITRTTGNTYTSISSTGNSINSWRHNDPTQMLDDNRSNPIPIGFDFWYDGARYTTLSVGINGIADFSSSAATGYTAGDYDSDNPTHNRMTSTATPYAWNCLALMYGDLTTQNQVDPLGTSFMYLTTGTAPNRVLTVEWINLSVWNQINTGTSWNFQLKLYESSGIFEFFYGNMTTGSASLNYKVGINAPSLAGGLTAAVVNIQQTANSTTFLPQRIPTTGYVSALPTSYSKLIFTPTTPGNPTNLTFSAVTSTSMTLNWNDNANNEVGYVLYNSLDGTNYTFVTQLAASSNSYPATGLIPGTTYYWRVNAVTEGRMSTNLEASRATNPAANFISQNSGRWSAGGTWVGGTAPTANSNVTIDNGDIVQYDVNNTFNNITVGQGTSGVLYVGRTNNNTTYTMNVLGDITINAGAQFSIPTTSNTTHQLNLTGDIVNNNVFDLATDANSLCQTTFNRSGNQTVSGTGATTRFNSMTMNMGLSSNNVLDITSSNFATRSTGFLTITNGTFKFSSPNAITPFSASTTIPLTGGLWVNSAAASVTTTGGNLSFTGYVRVSNGTLNIGNAADQQLLSNGGDLTIEGGWVNVAGSFNRTNNVTITRYTQTGGTLRVGTVSSASTTLSPFMMDVTGSSFNMIGGRIVVVREGGSGADDLGYLNTGSTTYSMTGGSIQIGDYSTPANQVIQVNTNQPVYNFVDSSANATAQLVTNNLNVANDILIAAGIMNANNLNIIVKRNWTNQGTFTSGTGTVIFDGIGNSAINKTGGGRFYNLTIDKQGSTTTLNNNDTVNNALLLAQGTFDIGATTLTLNGNVSSTGGQLVSLANGTVQYMQTSAGQPILTANYGNLMLNAFSKTFPSGTVGVAGAFTVPNPATAHVLTGNTINFNGTGVQSVPATSANFAYNNLSLSNSVTKTAAGAITISSTLNIGNSIAFDGGTNTIIVNGNIANSGSLTGSGAGAVVLSGGAAAHALSGSGQYRSVSLNDTQGATISGKATIQGTLTLTSGIINVLTDSDTLSFSSTGLANRVNGHVVGNVQMYAPTNSSSKLFPIGTASLYLPVRLELSNVGTAGFITIKRVSNQQHPQISHSSTTIDSTQDVQVYWKVSNDGVILSGNYNITFAFDQPTECIGGVSPTATDFVSERWNGSSWSSNLVGLRTTDSTRVDGLSAFGDFILGKSRAALLTAIKSGLWNDPTVWGGRIPTQNDTAKIVIPYAVTLAGNSSIAKLIINSGSIFSDSTFTLTISGHLILDGSWAGSGKISLTTANDTIYGAGSMIGSSILEIAGSNKTIAANASLTLRQVSILPNDTLYNLGSVSIDSLVGGGATSAFVNRPGSVLTINGPLMLTGSLLVGTCSNTVIYNGSVLQNIRPTTYCHVVMNNSGQKTASSNFDTNGDLTINVGSNLIINNNITVQVRGTATTAGIINNGGHLLISD